MSAVRDALALLTRLPVATASTTSPGAAAFALVGAGVGLIAAIPLVLVAGPLGEPWLGAIAAVAIMALLTGAMHLDGLADTADALMARDADAAERARTDPTLGSGGVLALVLVVVTQIVALGSLVDDVGPFGAGLALIAVATTSRVVPIVASLSVARARAAHPASLASWFTKGTTSTDMLIALGSAALIVGGLVALAARGPADDATALVVAIAGLAAALGGALLAGAIAALRHGLDGDGLGAIVELAMVSGLVVAAVAA